MTQQLVRGTPAGPLAAFADRLPPMIASADDRTGDSITLDEIERIRF